MEEREVIFLGVYCVIEGPSLYDLGEPDDLFADIHNFAVYAIFRLNLMILVMKGEKNYTSRFKPSSDHHHDH
jgi:hypothetical protein